MCQQKLDFDRKYWLQPAYNGLAPVTTGILNDVGDNQTPSTNYD